VTTGGVTTGGVTTGGVTTGGVATGGVATGGVVTGGVANGEMPLTTTRVNDSTANFLQFEIRQISLKFCTIVEIGLGF
jgi:hypothetical protein